MSGRASTRWRCAARCDCTIPTTLVRHKCLFPLYFSYITRVHTTTTNSYSNLSLCFTCGVSDSTWEYTNLKCVSRASLSGNFSQVLPGLTVCTVNSPRRGHRRTEMRRAAVAGAVRGGSRRWFNRWGSATRRRGVLASFAPSGGATPPQCMRLCL